MTLSTVVLGLGAVLAGIRALGYWVILQLGDPQPSDRGDIGAVLYGSAMLFLVLSSASAYLGDRSAGAGDFARRALRFAGICGLPPIAIFTVASRGAVLRLPEVTGLLLLFVCFAVVFRRRLTRQRRRIQL